MALALFRLEWRVTWICYCSERQLLPAPYTVEGSSQSPLFPALHKAGKVFHRAERKGRSEAKACSAILLGLASGHVVPLGFFTLSGSFWGWNMELTKEGGCRGAMICYLGLGSQLVCLGGKGEDSLASQVSLPIVKWLKLSHGCQAKAERSRPGSHSSCQPKFTYHARQHKQG